jgi:predicted negative regulator of RcsB-dependent stress response
MNAQKIIIIILILGLVVSNLFFGYKYYSLLQEFNKTKTTSQNQNINVNEKIIYFLNLFIEKVLKAEKEVDFETRLKLENAVREINDKEILDQWIKFTESKTEDEAQNNIKNLLDLLVGKIQTK